VNPLTGNSIDDVSNSVYLFVWIIISTLILLLVLKYYRGMIIFRLFEILVIFLGSQIIYSLFFYDIIISLDISTSQFFYEIAFTTLALLTVAIRFVWRNSFVMNTTLLISVSGVAGVLGATFGFIPCLVFVVLLSVYDFVSVFGTKHMIKLADQSRLRALPVMFETSASGVKTGPRKDRNPTSGMSKKRDMLGLGTGDVVIPSMFFVAIIRDLSLANFVGAYIGAFVGLALTIFYVTNIKRIALPALPPIIGCSILGLALSFLPSLL
jgi:presenilin-like A22 family membrane protease